MREECREYTALHAGIDWTEGEAPAAIWSTFPTAACRKNNSFSGETVDYWFVLRATCR